MNNFFKDNHKLIYQDWIHPDELLGASVLDLGSQTGWLGEYCVANGAREYVGVEINEYHFLDSRANYPSLTFFHMDLEDYVSKCLTENKIFDIVVISRTIHGIQNQVTMLQNLSKITKKIVIESGVPVNTPAYRLLEILKTIDVSNNYKQEIKEIQTHIEYEYPFIEYVIDDRWPQPVPSNGLLKDILSRLGFDLDLTTYESVKEKYPDEYGYGSRHIEDQLMKRNILKFTKANREPTSVTWREWDNVENK